MFKKINTTVLIIVLLGLAVVYFAVTYFDKSDRSFREVIVEFDPAEVSEVIIAPPNIEAVHLLKQGNDWRIITADKIYPADTLGIQNILSELQKLQTKRFAGKTKASWEKYELTDSMAIRVTLKDGSETVTDLMIGKFTYHQPKNQQQQQMYGRQQGELTSYVRLADENEVYAVEGFLKMNFNRDAASFRNKTLTSINLNDISRLAFYYPGRQMTLQNIEGKWQLNGAVSDSARTVKYLSSIARLTNQDFEDDVQVGSNAAYTVTIEGSNFIPIQIQAFEVSDTNINYAINSSVNRETYFNGSASGLFDKIFVSEDAFFAEEE